MFSTYRRLGQSPEYECSQQKTKGGQSREGVDLPDSLVDEAVLE